MKALLATTIVLLFAHGGVSAETGDAQAGKTLWEGPNTGCRNCPGTKGEGGVGQDLADVLAYFDTLPPVAQPGAWRFEVPAGAPRGQEVGLTVGCAQCHGPTFNVLRQGAGAVDGDFEWFKKSVYEHTTEQPRHFALLGQPQARLRMGNFSPMRVPEPMLQEIWTFVRDLGFRPQITAQLTAPAVAANGV